MLALFPPGDTRWRSQQTPSSWREFSFAFHKVAKAIEPTFTLRQMLTNRNPISEGFGGGLLPLVQVADLPGAFRLLSMQSVSAPLLASLTSRRARPYSDSLFEYGRLRQYSQYSRAAGGGQKHF